MPIYFNLYTDNNILFILHIIHIKITSLFLLFLFWMKTPLRKTFDNPEYLQKSRRLDHKCLCEICNCGKHKCPQKGYKLQTQTTNNYYYKPYNIAPQTRYRKAEEVLAQRYDPQLMKTSYRTDYSPQRVTRQPELINGHGKKYQPSKIKIDTQTQYNKHYIPKAAQTQRMKTQNIQTFRPNTAKFQGQSTYSRQYSPKKVDFSPSPIKKNNVEPKKVPFQGSTTYNNFYTTHKLQKTTAIKPNQSAMMNKSPRFQGQSRYRQFYKPYRLETKERCPTEYLPNPPEYRSPYKEHLHYSAEKNNWQ